MAVAKVRQGGAWALADAAGKAWVGGMAVGYGPDDETPTETVSLFTDQTPANPSWSEPNSALTLGTVINVNTPGQITGGRWLFPTTIPAGMTATYVLYDNLTGAQLRRVPFSSPTAGAWNVVTFAPYPVEVGASLVAAVYLAGAAGTVAYPFRGELFASVGITNGPLTGPRSNDEPRILGNGRYVRGDAYPDQSYNATGYYVDVLHEAVVVGGGGDLALVNPDRPVLSGQAVSLAGIAATDLAGGETLASYSWSVRSGGGSLSSTTVAAPTYTAPAGAGVAVVRATVTTSAGRTGWLDMRVGYASTIVAAENALPGTARSTWDLPVGELGGIASLQGFCDGFSINRDETANFKIGQSDGVGWSAELYRLGWYGGTGARWYATLTPSGPQLAASQAQPAPADVDPDTTLPSVDCAAWSTTLTWTPPAWTPSGVYVLRLNRTGGGASHVMFVVRDDDRAAALMMMPADSTWQAYNAFGGLGANLYGGNSLYYGVAVNQYHEDCARYVSYNRPVVNRGACDPGRSYGAVEWSNFFTAEFPMLRFVERNGIDVKYYACLDAAGDPDGELLGNVGAAMFVGHNEYWSDNMRSGWEAAKAAGVHVFSSAGNEVFWRLVGSDADAGGRPRTWECYKSTIGSRGSLARPEWTGTWRDPDGAGKGGDQPENTLTGTIFVVNGPDLRSLVVPYDGGFSASPLWRHTAVASLTAGQVWTSPGQILGFEWDTWGPDGTNSPGAAYLADPHPDAVYASSATYDIPSGLLLTGPGDEYEAAGWANHRLVIHPGGDGAIAFGAGTVNWALGLDNANTYQQGGDNTSPVLQQATINMLADMGAEAVTLMPGLTLPTPVEWFDDGGSGSVESWTMATPAGSTDHNEGTWLTLGTRFASTADGSWTGMRVWVTPTAPAGSPRIVAYNDDTNTRIGLQTYTEPALRGRYFDVEWDTPIPIVAGVTYMAAVHTTRYGYSAVTGLTLPLRSSSERLYSASGGVPLAEYRYGTEVNDAPPDDESANFFHVAPIVTYT
ncbi:N,N-dimethylformamidase beta subunit family domain-containing protein [Micromonospora sp. NPDC049366]|uniref:N,N-dimethylformamidase beta subunit family domain-containing protein n=1 Tax=Micromonospora sp. NPDC049366 TaxID=3364271 RepID=UPI0037996C75